MSHTSHQSRYDFGHTIADAADNRLHSVTLYSPQKLAELIKDRAPLAPSVQAARHQARRTAAAQAEALREHIDPGERRRLQLLRAQHQKYARIQNMEHRKAANKLGDPEFSARVEQLLDYTELKRRTDEILRGDAMMQFNRNLSLFIDWHDELYTPLQEAIRKSVDHRSSASVSQKLHKQYEAFLQASNKRGVHLDDAQEDATVVRHIVRVPSNRHDPIKRTLIRRLEEDAVFAGPTAAARIDAQSDYGAGRDTRTAGTPTSAASGARPRPNPGRSLSRGAEHGATATLRRMGLSCVDVKLPGATARQTLSVRQWDPVKLQGTVHHVPERPHCKMGPARSASSVEFFDFGPSSSVSQVVHAPAPSRSWGMGKRIAPAEPTRDLLHHATSGHEVTDTLQLSIGHAR